MKDRLPIAMSVFSRDDLVLIHHVLDSRLRVMNGGPLDGEATQQALHRAVEITKLQLKIQAALSGPALQPGK